MSQRRMFSLNVVGHDAFLDMPQTSQNLYFHLGMYADDDGFVSPRKVMRLVGASEDDLRVLLIKKYVIQFESNVLVVKHWRINNFIRKDRYRESGHIEEKSRLRVKKNQAYTLDKSDSVPISESNWKSDSLLVDIRSTEERRG